MITYLLMMNGVVLSLAAYWLLSVEVFDSQTFKPEGRLKIEPLLCGTIAMLNFLIAVSQ